MKQTNKQTNELNYILEIIKIIRRMNNKNVTPYSPTSLNVGTMVNAPLCNSLYLFLSFLCYSYILAIFAENFYYSSFCTLYSG